MTQEISKLPREVQELLSKAACIGNIFDLKTLSIIAEQSLDDIRRQLAVAVENSLIALLDENNSLLEQEPEKPAGKNAIYEFLHVRVRQAAYSLMTKKLGRTIHLQIGRLSMRGKTIAEWDERSFEITDHFNEGFQEIKEGAEKLLLVELNLASGRKAKKTAAFKEAIWYFSMGIGMLPPDKWGRHYDLTESLYLEAIEAEYLCSNFDRAELLSSEILKQAAGVSAQTKVRKAIDEAREQGLACMEASDGELVTGFNLPESEMENVIPDVLRETSLLDVSTVIKASQAIASEIELDQLLAKTMRIIIENAGAENGFLIENRDGKLFIQAQGKIGRDQVKTMQEIPLEESCMVPLSVINFVARTQSPVVLDDAFDGSLYATDKYINKYQIKSLLCLPIIYKGALEGAVYLENNLASGMFTPDRIELLKVLSTQAAISMENARLYASLGENIKEIKQAEQSLKFNFERSETLLKLNQMRDATVNELMKFAFTEAVRLTKSKIGYLAFLNEDETILMMQLWSRNVMTECAIDDKPIHYPVETSGLWGEAIRQRKAIITNDYNAPNPFSKD